MNKKSLHTSSDNEKRIRDESNCSKSKWVRFNINKEPELKMKQVQSPDPDTDEIKVSKGATQVINNGLRRSPRLNPKMIKGKELIALQIMLSNVEAKDKQVKGEILAITTEINSINNKEYEHPLAYKASTDPDTMYMHEAMKEKDRNQFILAMKKKVEDPVADGNHTIVHVKEVPTGKIILPAV